jgi:Ca-activated chloride channel family protein
MAPQASLAAACLLCSLGFAQQTQTPSETVSTRIAPEALPLSTGAPYSHLRVDSTLVLIPVHVTTPSGTSVTNLKTEHFRLFEDNAEQKVTHFAKDDAPISIGLVFDTSGSMHNKIRKSSEAAATFFKTANAEDEFFLVEFNEHPKLTVSFTPDSLEIYRRIAHIHPFGRTSLLDAIHLALVQMKGAHNLRKAIVILSDGGDNRSRFTVSEVKNAMLESDVQMYAMGIFDPEEIRRKTSEEEKGPKLLEILAEQTGGRLYYVENLDDLTTISARIGTELRNQYLLGYSSTNSSRDGKFRRVRVNLSAPPDMPNLKSYYRHGYYAPSE